MPLARRRMEPGEAAEQRPGPLEGQSDGQCVGRLAASVSAAAVRTFSGICMCPPRDRSLWFFPSQASHLVHFSEPQRGNCEKTTSRP